METTISFVKSKYVSSFDKQECIDTKCTDRICAFWLPIYDICNVLYVKCVSRIDQFTNRAIRYLLIWKCFIF